MRFLLLFLFLTNTLWAAVMAPQDGLYNCIKGNDDSICEQRLKSVKASDGKVIGVKVTYEGWCNVQGPYSYECEDGTCTDWVIRITFKNEKQYRWENLDYGFTCEMEKSN